MKRTKFAGLTEGQTETLLAIDELNKRSSGGKTVDEVVRARFDLKTWDTRASKPKGYFGMYLTSTYKMLEELTRKGYVDQLEKPTKKETQMADKRPYRITKKGKEKVKRESK